MEGARFGGTFITTCKDKWTGAIKWSDTSHNLVVSTGLIHLLDVGLSGGTANSTWHIGLMEATPTVATGDIMSTHGFDESTVYSQANRVEWEEGRTGVSVSNTGNLATFTLNVDGSTIGGAFLASSNTKNGTAGVLLCGAAFSGGDKTGDSGDKLEVTYTFSAADDGV